ncbi:MAG: hypothetical protein U0132_04270 [Gemmatimonadaceae bacterium]
MRGHRTIAALLGMHVLLGAHTIMAQATAAKPLDWSAEDSSRIAELRASGQQVTRPHAVLWAPRDSIARATLAALADSVDRGLTAVMELIGAPMSWQRIGSNPVIYYLSPNRFVSHASGLGAVFIAVSRVRDGTAPFLHEALHELLAPHPPFWWDEYPDSINQAEHRAQQPLWLMEGMPDYLAQVAADRAGVHEGDVFQIGGNAGTDSACVNRVTASSKGDEILASVGRNQRLEALFTTDRATVAPAFYACSRSFAKFIVGRIGVPAAVDLFPAIQRGEWEQQLERVAREPTQGLRRAWLMSLGLRRP